MSAPSVETMLRGLHRPLGVREPCWGWTTCRRDHEELDGGEIIHPDDDGTLVCDCCRGEDGEYLLYPCPTVELIDEHAARASDEPVEVVLLAADVAARGYRERAERAEAARDALAALLSAVREAAEFGDEVDEPGTARAILRILDGGADRG